MARSRNIKPGFFTNDQLVECPMATRLLFVGVWTLADREGRLADRPKKIKMEVFPADDVDVDAGLADLAARGFLVRYEVDGAAYLQVVNWHVHQNPHQREAQSTIPAPPQAGAEPPPSAPQAQPRLDHDISKAVPSHSQDNLIPDSGFLVTDSLIPDSGLPLPEPTPIAARKAKPKPALLERSEEEAQVLSILFRVEGFPADAGDDTTERLRELAADFEGVNLLDVAKELRLKGTKVKNGWLTYRNWLDTKRRNLEERRSRAPSGPVILKDGTEVGPHLGRVLNKYDRVKLGVESC